MKNVSTPTSVHSAPTAGYRLSTCTRLCLSNCFWPRSSNKFTQQWSRLAYWQLSRREQGKAVRAVRTVPAVFHHHGESDVNLREYLVVLEKPVGLTLAPDPRTGQVVVQDIKPGSPAHESGLIQVGDVVKQCSAVFGDDMWPAVDIRRVRWAINNRMGDVKLLMERCRMPAGGVTAWYCRGKAGVATREKDGMQLPYTFNGPAGPEEVASFLELPGAGRAMQIAFHRNTVTQPPASSRPAATAAAARTAALQQLRRELAEAWGMPRLNMRPNLHQRAGGTDGFVLPPTATSANTASAGVVSRPTVKGSGRGATSSPHARASSSSGGSGGERASPEVDVVSPPPPSYAATEPGKGNGNGMSSGNGNGNGGVNCGDSGLFRSKLSDGHSDGNSNNDNNSNTAAGTSAAAAPGTMPTAANDSNTIKAHKNPQVVTFLPWLLVSRGQLEHRHLAIIASNRSLGALLELSITRTQKQPPPQPPSSSSSSPPTTTALELTPQGAVEAVEAVAATAVETASEKGDVVSNEAASDSSSSNSRGGSSSSSSSSGSRGKYLVVRGADLMPLASDVGRLSYPTLLAAASGATTPKSGSRRLSSQATAAPPTSVGRLPPPPGSAAATAAMLHGADVIAVDDGSFVTMSLTDANGPDSGVSGTGGSAADDGGGSGGGGLGSNSMAFINRSIILNLRPNRPFGSSTSKALLSSNTASFTTASSSTTLFSTTPSSSATYPSSTANPNSSSSDTLSAATTAASCAPASSQPSFVYQLMPRYDPLRIKHLLNAAASLHRLAFRRGGRLHRARRAACAVLLHCDEGMEADVAVLLAGWLHWYGKLPLQEAILAAETAMAAEVDQDLLEASTLALLQGAQERSSRVVLTWKYGGLSAFVAGDVVASWGSRVPLERCRSPLGCKGDTHLGHFYLEIQGLRPGVYHYKYIVDGTWAVDSYSPKVLDAAGNWNNVLMVPEPPVVLTSREGLALARWQAVKLALETKMGLDGLGALHPQQRPV